MTDILLGNRTVASYPPQESVHALISLAAGRNPQSPALLVPTGSGGRNMVTYAQLEARAIRLAAGLRDCTYRSDLIGLVFERSIEMIVSILGVLKLGVRLSGFKLTPAKEAEGNAAAAEQEAKAAAGLSRPVAGRAKRDASACRPPIFPSSQACRQSAWAR